MRSESIVVLALIVINFIGCACLAASLNIWTDEAYTLHTTDDGLRYALSQALRFENQAPFYFIVLDVWRMLNHSIFFARLFSMLFISAALLTLASLAKRFPGSRALIVAAAAVNPITIQAAIDARVYALAILLSALLMLSFFRGFWDDPADKKWQWAYLFFALLALYTQYYIAFLLLAQAMLLFIRRPNSLRFYALGMLGVLALFVPLLMQLRSQIGVNRAAIGLHTSLWEYCVQLAAVLLHYAFPLSVDHHGLTLTFVIVVLSGTLLLTASHFHFDYQHWLTYIGITTIAGAAMVIVVALTGSLISDRYAAFLFIPLLLTVYSFFGYPKNRRKQLYAALWTAAVVVVSAWTLWLTYSSGAKIGDWKRVAAYIQENEGGGQPILVFRANEALPLGRYYAGVNALVPIPHPIDFDTWAIGRDLLHSPQQIAAVLTPSQRRARYVWLVRSDTCSWLGIDYHCEVLDTFVRDSFRIVSSKQFVDSHVELLQRVR